MILKNSAKDAMLQGFADLLKTGAVTLDIYASADLMVSMSMPNPVVSSIAGGLLTFNAPEKSIVLKTGAPNTAKIAVDGVAIAELAVGSDLVIGQSTLFAGGYLNLTALSINI